jgi:hypothetical protein
MKIQITQFIPPNGRKEEVTTEVSDECKPQYEAILRNGLRLTAELLRMHNTVSCCIENLKYGDFDISLTVNGPQVQTGLEEMLKRFDEQHYLRWLSEMEKANDE